MSANEYLDLLHSIQLAIDNLTQARSQYADSMTLLNALWYARRASEQICNQAKAEGIDLEAAEREREELPY